MAGKIEFQPVGYFRCSQTSPTDSPRQSVLGGDHSGIIQLSPTLPQEVLLDLEGFSHIWLLYLFHENTAWKPLVRPPRGEKKRGVFATRSPYRPNPIGMSCVELLDVLDREIRIKGHDLLDQTPILDIKPYLKYADSFPESNLGWLADIKSYQVTFDEKVQLEMVKLSQQLDVSLKQIIANQLSYEPTNSKIKRVKKVADNYEFAYKTWRFSFSIDARQVHVFDMKSVT